MKFKSDRQRKAAFANMGEGKGVKRNSIKSNKEKGNIIKGKVVVVKREGQEHVWGIAKDQKAADKHIEFLKRRGVEGKLVTDNYGLIVANKEDTYNPYFCPAGDKSNMTWEELKAHGQMFPHHFKPATEKTIDWDKLDRLIEEKKREKMGMHMNLDYNKKDSKYDHGTYLAIRSMLARYGNLTIDGYEEIFGDLEGLSEKQKKKYFDDLVKAGYIFTEHGKDGTEYISIENKESPRVREIAESEETVYFVEL